MISYIKDYLYMRENKVPSKLYVPYFKEKFKVDVISAIKIMILFPQILVTVFAVCLTFFAEMLILLMHYITPNWLKLSDDRERKQIIEANKIRKYISKKENKNADTEDSV